MDSQFESLASALDEIFQGRLTQQQGGLMQAVSTATDECDKATGASEKVRQEIEKNTKP